MCGLHAAACMPMYTNVHHGTHMKFCKQLVDAMSIILQYGSEGWNSGDQFWNE